MTTGRRWAAGCALAVMVWGLAVGPAAGAEEPTADEARGRAQEILSENEYRDDGGPINRPIREVERWFDRNPTTTQYRPPERREERRPRPPQPQSGGNFNWLADLGPVLVGVILAALAALLALLVWAIIRSIRKRDKEERSKRKQPKRGDRRPVADAEALDPDVIDIREPDRIDALAGEAEAAGDFSRAVRLRFRAGLLRLDEAGVLAFDSSLTTGQIMRALQSTTFDGLAMTFDRVVYGEVPATLIDADTARSQWPEVIRQTSRAGAGSPR